MKKEEQQDRRLLVTKGDTFWIVLVILALLGGYKIGVLTEKMGAVEDAVFNNMIYPQTKIIAEREVK